MTNVEADIWIKENPGMIINLVHRFNKVCSGKFSEEDLTQEANLAIVKAAKTFEEDYKDENGRPTKFSTFAYKAVYFSLRDYVRMNKHDLKVTAYKDGKDYRESLEERDETPTEESEWGQPIVFTPSTIAWRMDVQTGGANSDGEGSPFGDTIASGVPPPLEDMIVEEEKENLHAAIDSLPERERKVLHGIYFHDKSIAQIALEEGCSRQWIHQIQRKALGKLKSTLGSSID